MRAVKLWVGGLNQWFSKLGPEIPRGPRGASKGFAEKPKIIFPPNNSIQQ